jgi:adenylate kinase
VFHQRYSRIETERPFNEHIEELRIAGISANIIILNSAVRIFENHNSEDYLSV